MKMVALGVTQATIYRKVYVKNALNLLSFLAVLSANRQLNALPVRVNFIKLKMGCVSAMEALIFQEKKKQVTVFVTKVILWPILGVSLATI